MAQPSTNQFERLLRAQGLQLARISDTIPEGEDLKNVCDAAYANASRTLAIIASFDIPEVLAHDPKKGEPRA